MNSKDIQLKVNIETWLRSHHHLKPIYLKFGDAGNTDSFTYVPELTALPLNKLLTYRGGCHVGDLPTDSLSQITEILQEIPIIRHDLLWDCQIWVIQATKLLKSAGFVFAHVDERYIRDQLLKDMAI
jgi:hypothetical protein